LKAIVTSGILFEKDSTLQQWTEVVNLLLDLAKKKPWLREECGFVIYAALHKCNEDLTQAAIERLASHGLVRTPEGVAIWLRARDKFGPTILPASIWPHQDPMHSSNHALLAQILKETTLAKEKDAVDLEGSHERGSWKSKLHFAWDGVLTKSVEMSSSSKSSKISSNGQSRFQNFWNTVVDGKSLNTTSRNH
jgi:DNA polymerase phi